MTFAQLISDLQRAGETHRLDLSQIEDAITEKNVIALCTALKLSRISTLHLVTTATVQSFESAKRASTLCKTLLQVMFRFPSICHLKLDFCAMSVDVLDPAIKALAKGPKLTLLELDLAAVAQTNPNHTSLQALARAQHSPRIRFNLLSENNNPSRFFEIKLDESKTASHENILRDRALLSAMDVLQTPNRFVSQLLFCGSISRLKWKGNLTNSVCAALRAVLSAGKLEEVDLRDCSFSADNFGVLVKDLEITHPLTLQLVYKKIFMPHFLAMSNAMKTSPLLKLYAYADTPSRELLTAIDGQITQNHPQAELTLIDQLFEKVTSNSSRYLDTIRNRLIDYANWLTQRESAIGKNHPQIIEQSGQWLWRAMQWQLQQVTEQNTPQIRVELRGLFAQMSPDCSAYIRACMALKTFEVNRLNSEVTPIVESSYYKLVKDRVTQAQKNNFISQGEAEGIRSRWRELSETSAHDHQADDGDSDRIKQMHCAPRQINSDLISATKTCLTLRTVDVFARAVNQHQHDHKKTDNFLLNGLVDAIGGRPSVHSEVLKQNIERFPAMRDLMLYDSLRLVGLQCANSAEFFDQLKRITRTQLRSSRACPSLIDLVVSEETVIAFAHEHRLALADHYEKFTQSQRTERENAIAIFNNMITPGGWSWFMSAAYGRRDQDIALAILERLNDPNADVRQIMLEGIDIQLRRYPNPKGEIGLRDNSCARRMVYCLARVTSAPSSEPVSERLSDGAGSDSDAFQLRSAF